MICLLIPNAAAHLVNRFSHLLHDMELVIDVDGIRGILLHRGDVGRRHVGCYQLYLDFFTFNPFPKRCKRVTSFALTDVDDSSCIKIHHYGLIYMSFADCKLIYTYSLYF